MFLKVDDGVQINVPLPETLFYQIDGGSENVSEAVIGMREFLVARRVFKKIVLCRLPVGHTHEDIDAKFAKIWNCIRSKHVLTPQEYNAAIRAALVSSEHSIRCNVVDLFVVPDYTGNYLFCIIRNFLYIMFNVL